MPYKLYSSKNVVQKSSLLYSITLSVQYTLLYLFHDIILLWYSDCFTLDFTEHLFLNFHTRQSVLFWNQQSLEKLGSTHSTSVP